MAVGAIVGTGVEVGLTDGSLPPQAATRARANSPTRGRITSLAARRVVKEFIHIL